MMADKPIANPVTLQERIGSIDILRGVAVLGILVMNIQLYAMISAAYFNPTSYGDLNGANRLIWLFSHLFADMKFISLFSLLFGAGILLFSDKAEAKGVNLNLELLNSKRSHPDYQCDHTDWGVRVCSPAVAYLAVAPVRL